jgi:ElaB/YqjD/DUF883 family membrane-anchored ribosome-binding protein
MANTTKEDIRERAGEAQQKVESGLEKGKSMLSQAAEKGREMAQTAAEKAKEAGTAVRDRADSGVASMGSGIRSAAEGMRERLPQSGMIGSAASSIEDTLESTGRYLEEKGVSGAAEDLTMLIRRHPVPSVLIGLGVGILLGQFLTSSRR